MLRILPAICQPAVRRNLSGIFKLTSCSVVAKPASWVAVWQEMLDEDTDAAPGLGGLHKHP